MNATREAEHSSFSIVMSPQLRVSQMARSTVAADPSQLTGRELEVVRMTTAGLTSKEIAVLMGLSYHTVCNHLRSIYQKTGVPGRAALVLYAVVHGLVDELIRQIRD